MKRAANQEEINHLEARLKQLKGDMQSEIFTDALAKVTRELASTTAFLQKAFEYMDKLSGIEFVKDKKLVFSFSDGHKLVFSDGYVTFTAFPELHAVAALEKHLFQDSDGVFRPIVVARAVAGFLWEFVLELRSSEYTDIIDDNIDEIHDWMDNYRDDWC